jgi:alpha 1,2-mannosyltransferase
MASLFSPRLSKGAVVLITFILVYLVFVCLPRVSVSEIRETAFWPKIRPGLGESQKTPTTSSSSPTSQDTSSKDEDSDAIPASSTAKAVDDAAHRLPTADSFISHFHAVTQLPGMTMAEAKSGCTWSEDSKVNFQYVPETEWVAKDRDDAEIQTRRDEWHDFIRNDLLPYDHYKDRFAGRGIIILAGNKGTLKRVRVLLRALAQLKSELPVEIHYYKEEMTDESRANLTSLWPDKIYFNDLSEPSNIVRSEYSIFSNYHLKTAAVINSRFAEPLLLDSDNVPAIDPAELYESATYRKFGTVFWPDIARTRPNNPIWSITNTKCRMDEFEQESGQMLVDKRRFFYHLQLAAWFNNAKGGYYNEFLLGDKDMFRFTWHALKTKYGFPAKWLTSVGTVNDDFYCGHTFAQHHPDEDDGRVAFMHGGLLKTLSKDVIRWQRDDQGGIFQAYKRTAYDEDFSVSTEVGIKFDSAGYLPHKPKNFTHVAMCTDMYKVEARPLDDIALGFEQFFDDVGGYFMIN